MACCVRAGSRTAICRVVDVDAVVVGVFLVVGVVVVIGGGGGGGGGDVRGGIVVGAVGVIPAAVVSIRNNRTPTVRADSSDSSDTLNVTRAVERDA